MHQFPIVPSYKRWVSNNGRRNTPINRLRWIFIVVTRSLRYSKRPAICENVHQKALDEHWDMIDEEKWSCVEAARNGLNHEK